MSLESLAYKFPYGSIGSYSTGFRTVDTALQLTKIQDNNEKRYII